MRVFACLLVLLASGAVSCGGEGGGGGTEASKKPVPKKPPRALAARCAPEGGNLKAEPVWFRAKDGTLLDGAAIGDGDVAVVLAHEYPSNLCLWLPYAKTLADHGFRAFVFDFRGLGDSRSAGPYEDAGRYDWDV